MRVVRCGMVRVRASDEWEPARFVEGEVCVSSVIFQIQDTPIRFLF